MSNSTNLIASSSYSGAVQVCLWDLRMQNEVGEIETRHADKTTKLAFDAQGTTLALAGRSGCELFDIHLQPHNVRLLGN